MSKVTISIKESTFARLQRHARPLIDSIDAVIELGLDALEKGGRGDERLIDPHDLPSLRHTKVLSLTIGGEPMRANWNNGRNALLYNAIRHVPLDNLAAVCSANIVRGRKTTKGFSHLAPADVSVQGQDANAACKTMIAIAKHLGLPLDVLFRWRNKEGAAHPGEYGRLIVRADADRTSMVGL